MYLPVGIRDDDSRQLACRRWLDARECAKHIFGPSPEFQNISGTIPAPLQIVSFGFGLLWLEVLNLWLLHPLDPQRISSRCERL